MSSSLDNTCSVYDTKVLEPGPLGDCEHLRTLLGAECNMKAGELWWMTDRAPHESLPLEEKQYRQYMRLVTGEIDAWYTAHSTPNPLGIVPPPSVAIITHDKFTGFEPGSN